MCHHYTSEPAWLRAAEEETDEESEADAEEPPAAVPGDD
jgi:uncharacterized damage-inducible protein DinB